MKSNKNGNFIFLPAAGYRDGTSLDYAGSYGVYWISSPEPDYGDYAYYMYFDSGEFDWYDITRYYGFTVRPVLE